MKKLQLCGAMLAWQDGGLADEMMKLRYDAYIASRKRKP